MDQQDTLSFLRKNGWPPAEPRWGLNLVFVLVTDLLLLLWLISIFYFPTEWRDRDGYNELSADIAINGLLLLDGLVLGIAASFGVVGWRLVLAVLAAPFVHLLGAPLGLPLAFVLFVAPSIVIALLGLAELKARSTRE